VAPGTKNNQIFSLVIAKAAPWLYVMDLEVVGSPTDLATPAVSFQHFTAELAVRFSFQFQAWSSGSNCAQETFRILSKSCSRCGTGRPSTNRVMAGRSASWFPVSKLTPARKSAQIISRQ
jgi:hypothetical protein